MTDATHERRHGARHLACFPGFVEHGEHHDKIVAMIGDLAEGGARLLLRKPDLHVGEPIKFDLHISLQDDTPRVATGRVVRIDPLPDDRASLWTHEVGVEFDAPITLSAAEVDALDKRQEPFGKRAR
jgi:PilZ domain